MAYVINDNEISEMFKTTIGVKQGGCLSPRLFTLYVEDVIPIIESLNLGTKIGEIMIDIILYADDMLLITDTKWKFEQMLNVLTEYGANIEIKFNGSKTTLMIYNKSLGDNRPQIKIKIKKS